MIGLLLPRFARIKVQLPCILLLVMGAPVLPAQQPDEQTAEVPQLWADGVAKIVHGDFSQARDSLARILSSRPGDEHYLQVASWLDQRSSTINTRTELHHQQREQYLQRAKKCMAREQWAEALGWTRNATECSTEEPTFMREPWVQELHDKALHLAEQNEQQRKWAEAGGLYYELKNMFQGHQLYEQKMEDCLDHSRLEAIYGPDSKWQSRLEGITQRMVDDVLKQIHDKYVVDADFKIIAKHALHRLRLLADSESLAAVFTNLKDEAKRDQYIRRLNRLANKIDRAQVYGYKDLADDGNDDAFSMVMTINSQTFELPPELIVYEFLEGALSADQTLDEFTSMIWPVEFAEFEKHTQGHFPGVGIQIMLEDNQLTVVSPLEDTPAFRAGIQPGDKITHVDGVSTDGMPLPRAVQVITGPIKSKVVLTLYRDKQSFDVELIRDEIEIKSVKGQERISNSEKWNFLIDPEFRIGYIRLTNFAENTTAEMRKAVNDLQDHRARGLILDLRFNPGGLLKSAIEVSEIFLPDDSLIVTTEGLHSEPFSKDSQSRGGHVDLPLIVLVNEQSASASEIVSGALKDHGRALIVGERSFGKGSVQNLIPVGASNAHLKLTTAYYYLPSGRLIHKAPESDVWGVEPDIQVKLVPREQHKIYSMRREADVIRGPGAPQPPAHIAALPAEDGALSRPQVSAWLAGPPSLEELEELAYLEETIEYPAVDYQLETALLVLRVQLLEKLGFDILPPVKLGAKEPPTGQHAVVTN